MPETVNPTVPPPVRLVPAALVEGGLRMAVSGYLARFPDHMFWMRANPAVSWTFSVPKHGDWDCRSRAVVVGDAIIGYASASTSPLTNSVVDIMAISLTPSGSLAYAVGLRQFMRELITSYRSVRWSCVEGAPTETAYRRMAERLGGGQVGRFPDASRTSDGQVRAVLWFWIPGTQP